MEAEETDCQVWVHDFCKLISESRSLISPDPWRTLVDKELHWGYCGWRESGHQTKITTKKKPLENVVGWELVGSWSYTLLQGAPRSGNGLSDWIVSKGPNSSLSHPAPTQTHISFTHCVIIHDVSASTNSSHHIISKNKQTNQKYEKLSHGLGMHFI